MSYSNDLKKPTLEDQIEEKGSKPPGHSNLSRTDTNDSTSSKDGSRAVNFQYNQYPIPGNGFVSADNSPVVTARNKFTPGSAKFADRFRLQSYPVAKSPKNSLPYYNGNGNVHGRSRSTVTSPIDIPIYPASSTENHATTDGLTQPGDSEDSFSGRYPYENRPKKWYSFTNLLSKHNISHLLSFSKSRLNVSSTLNSVFVSPTSPRGETSAIPDNFKAATLSSSYNPQSGDKPLDTAGLGYCVEPVSPSFSCATVSGEYPSKSSVLSGIVSTADDSTKNSPLSQVVYRRKTVSSTHGRDADFSSCGKRSSTGTTTSGSVSERSSGIGVALLSNYSNSNSTPRASRFSYGECSSGTANSPVFSTGTPNDGEYSFPFHIGQSSSADIVGHDNSQRSSGVPTLGRSLPTLLGMVFKFFSGLVWKTCSRELVVICWHTPALNI